MTLKNSQNTFRPCVLPGVFEQQKLEHEVSKVTIIQTRKSNINV